MDPHEDMSSDSVKYFWLQIGFEFMQTVVIFYAFFSGIFSTIHTLLSDCYHKQFIGAINVVGFVHIVLTIFVLLYAKVSESSQYTMSCINFHKWSLCCLTFMLMLCLQKIMQHWYPKKVFLQWLLVIYTCCNLFVWCWFYQENKGRKSAILDFSPKFQMHLATCREKVADSSLLFFIEYGLIYIPYFSCLECLFFFKKDIFGTGSELPFTCCSLSDEKKCCHICYRQGYSIPIFITYLAFIMLLVRPLYLLYYALQNTFVSDILPCISILTISLFLYTMNLKSYIFHKKNKTTNI